jgi:drug/metabolite transporter (DMT)-like permease
MNLKNLLQNRLRGWLPKEPNLPSHPTATTPQTKLSHKINLPKSEVPKMLVWSLMVFGLVMGSVGYFRGGNAFGAFLLWSACVIGVSLARNVSVLQGKEWSPKLAMAVLLVVVSLGGVLVNVYVFSVPSSLFVKAFSLLMMLVVNVPLLLGVWAYVWGKKELSKKLLDWFSMRR